MTIIVTKNDQQIVRVTKHLNMMVSVILQTWE